MTKQKFLLLFCASALVPLIAAKASLALGWFSGGNTNKGLWMEQELQLLPALAASDPHWRLAYVQLGECTAECTAALYVLQQLYSGLGRKQLNVQPILLAPTQAQALQNFPALKWHATTASATVLAGQIVILNQQGIALLRYPPTQSIAQMPALAKDIRSDLLRLMNYDRSSL